MPEQPRPICLAVVDMPPGGAMFAGAVASAEVAEAIDRMILALQQQPDLPTEVHAAGIRIIVAAAIQAALSSDRLVGLHALDRGAMAIGSLGAFP